MKPDVYKNLNTRAEQERVNYMQQQRTESSNEEQSLIDNSYQNYITQDVGNSIGNVENLSTVKGELKERLREEKEKEFDANVHRLDDSTTKIRDQFVEKKKDEVWEQFINYSLDVVNLNKSQESIYTRLGEQQGKNGEKELKKKAGKYVKEKVSILNNKRYDQDKKDRKLKVLRDETMRSIKGYDEYVANMAFSNTDDFKDSMEENGVDVKSILPKVSAKKIEKMVKCRLQYEIMCTKVDNVENMEENHGLTRSTKSLIENYDKGSVISKKDKMKNTINPEVICSEIRAQIDKLGVPGESLADIADEAAMEKVISDSRSAKLLINIITTLNDKCGELGKNLRLKNEYRALYISIEKFGLNINETKILQTIAESEQTMKGKWGIKDLVVEKKAEQVQKPRTIKEEFKENLEGLNENEKKFVEEEKRFIVKNSEMRDAIMGEFGTQYKTDIAQYTSEILMKCLVEGDNRFNWVTVMANNYDARAEKSLRVFAKLISEDKELLASTQKADMKVLGKPAKNLLRGGANRYANFMGFDHMSEAEMLDMMKNIAIGSLEREKTETENTKTSAAMKQLIGGYVSHFDYMERKYGANLTDMPLSELMKVMPDIQRDMAMTLDSSTFSEEAEAFLDEAEKERFQTCKKQMKYYASIDNLIQTKFYDPTGDYTESEDYIKAKAVEKELFTQSHKSVTEIDMNVTAESPDAVYKRQGKMDLKIQIKPRTTEETFTEKLDDLNAKEANYVQKQIDEVVKKKKDITEAIEEYKELMETDPVKFCEKLSKERMVPGQEKAKKGIDVTELQTIYDARSLKSFRVFAKVTGGISKDEVAAKKNSGVDLSVTERIANSIGNPEFTVLGKPQKNLFRGLDSRYANFMGFDHMSETEMIDMVKNLAIGNLPEEKSLEEETAIKSAMKKFVDGQVSHFDYLQQKYGNKLMDLPLEQLVKILPEVQRDLSITVDAQTLIEGMDVFLDEKDKEKLSTCKKQMKYYSLVSDIIVEIYLSACGGIERQEGQMEARARIAEMELFNPANKSVEEIDMNVSAEHPDVVYTRQQKQNGQNISEEEQEQWEKELKLCEAKLQMILDEIKEEDVKKTAEVQDRWKSRSLEATIEEIRSAVVYAEAQKVRSKGLDDEVKSYQKIKGKQRELEEKYGIHVVAGEMIGAASEIGKVRMATLQQQIDKRERKTSDISKEFMDEKKMAAWEALINKPLKTQEELEKERKKKNLSEEDERYEALVKSQSGGASLHEKIMLYKQGVQEINNKNYNEDKKERKLQELKEKTIGEIQGYDMYVKRMALGKNGDGEGFKEQLKKRGIDSELNFVKMDMKAAERVQEIKGAYLMEREELLKEIVDINAAGKEVGAEKSKEEIQDIKNKYWLEQMELKDYAQIMKDGTKEKIVELTGRVQSEVNKLTQIQPAELSLDAEGTAGIKQMVKDFEKAKVLKVIWDELEEKGFAESKAIESQLTKIIGNEEKLLKRIQLKDFVIVEENASMGEQQEKNQ